MKREVKIGDERITFNVHKACSDKTVAELFKVKLQDIYDVVENNRSKFSNEFACRCEKEAPDGVRMLFTEKGVCMLATLLHTEEAEACVLAMVETFVAMKGFMEDLKKALIEEESADDEADKDGDEKKDEDEDVDEDEVVGAENGAGGEE